MRAAIFLLCVIAGQVHAGYVMRVKSTAESNLQSRELTSRVFRDGQRERIELEHDPDEVRLYDVAISTDATTTTLINLQNKTYFRSDEMKANPLGSRTAIGMSWLFHMPVASDEKFAKISTSVIPPSAAHSMLGHAITRHELQISYVIRGSIQGSPIKANVMASLVRYVTSELPADAVVLATVTGLPEVDAAIAKWSGQTHGFVVREEMTVARTIQGGATQRESVVREVETIEEKAVSGDLFKVPTGLTHQLPQVGVPGRYTEPFSVLQFVEQPRRNSRNQRQIICLAAREDHDDPLAA